MVYYSLTRSSLSLMMQKRICHLLYKQMQLICKIKIRKTLMNHLVMGY